LLATYTSALVATGAPSMISGAHQAYVPTLDAVELSVDEDMESLCDLPKSATLPLPRSLTSTCADVQES
jgi:hypothetical protein